jgi:hypothetical protein
MNNLDMTLAEMRDQYQFIFLHLIGLNEYYLAR